MSVQRLVQIIGIQVYELFKRRFILAITRFAVRSRASWSSKSWAVAISIYTESSILAWIGAAGVGCFIKCRNNDFDYSSLWYLYIFHLNLIHVFNLLSLQDTFRLISIIMNWLKHQFNFILQWKTSLAFYTNRLI